MTIGAANIAAIAIRPVLVGRQYRIPVDLILRIHLPVLGITQKVELPDLAALGAA